MNRRSARLLLPSALVAALGVAGCLGGDSPTQPTAEEVEFAPELGIDLSSMDRLPSGLWIRDEEAGAGPAAGPWSTLEVDYQGWLPDGRLFDSSLDREPFTLVVGEGGVIPGFGQGLLGMREGGVRLILVPPALGYGANPPGTVIPPNSWMVFRLYMRSVEEG